MWHLLFARWILKVTNIHSECVILITFPRQKWLRQRASTLSYMCLAYDHADLT